MASLQKSVLRSSQGPQSRPMTTPRRRRAARAVRRVRAAREQRRRRALQIGNSKTYKKYRKSRSFCFTFGQKKFNSSYTLNSKFGLICRFKTVSLFWSQSQGCRHRLSQHHGGSWRRRRGGRGRASRRLRGSDHAGTEGESSVYITMLKMHCD